jgi:hypothetical protein
MVFDDNGGNTPVLNACHHSLIGRSYYSNKLLISTIITDIIVLDSCKMPEYYIFKDQQAIPKKEITQNAS